MNEHRAGLELLAPAGDWAALEAALEAGTGAVYFGLTTLNARRRARNFHQEEFARAVEAVHARAARAYLTLNIDLADRELGQAARILEFARQCRADAVLVRDPALLALRSHFPELEFHFSTQTCMANSADVAAAGALGASRVVLAREMSLAEIAAASAVEGVETEVFVQGALCFSVSGRCLLSSWVGGRSGNRGACTSPCRVPWTIEGQAAGTPLSMLDLAAAHRLDDLRRAGVTGLKIEGRLKSAEWVRRAVGLYRRALDGEAIDPEALLGEAAELGAYTGRGMTSGYLDGRREDLTGTASGRTAPAEAGGKEDGGKEDARQENEGQKDEGPEDDAVYDLAITIQPRGINCRCDCAGRSMEWSIPKTVVRRAHKAVPIELIFARLSVELIQGCELRRTETNDPEFLMVPRAANSLIERISAAIRQARKAPGEMVRVSLPAEVQQALEKDSPHQTNRRKLGDTPDRVRLHAKQVAGFLRQIQPEGLIVEGATADALPRVLEAADEVHVVAALPQVFFEDDLPAMRKLVQACKEARLTVEVNSWGGWQLARQAGVRMEGGPGLGVLNSLAARMLREAGFRAVTLSIEADRRQLEELTAQCGSPCSMVVFGRPPLLTTRARLPEEQLGKVFEDRRGARLVPRLERGLTVFRPVEPFDLRGQRNERIRVRHLVVDLVGSEEPVAEWRNMPGPNWDTFGFNYDRSLW